MSMNYYRVSGSLNSSAASNPASSNRNASSVSHTPAMSSTLDSMTAPHLDDAASDVPPPSYEEAIGISPRVPSPATTANTSRRPVPPVPSSGFSSDTLAVPEFGLPNGYSGLGGNRRISTGSHTSVRQSGIPSAGRPVNSSALPSQPSSAFGHSKPGAQQSQQPNPPERPAASYGNATGSRVNGGQPPASAALGSVPSGRQFPAMFNLYSEPFSRSYFIGEHQQTPLYVVRKRSMWPTGPVIALHNGPNPETAPLLAAVDHIFMSSNMSITLPPPLSYDGTGSTAVRLESITSWSSYFTFTMEVGTDLHNVHREVFEWRHSYGNAIAALGGARRGWKLVRMSTAALPGAPQSRPAPGFMSSDGHEVVAMFSEARMSMTKELKFAFAGTGLTGALGERWSVMAVTSALAIWQVEEADRQRRH
ncbi:hypothetical protein SEPCBS57363_000130 [Sporothrix epigloea]|uniref:Uncharacterized protein n=1 Tax=Sporothrix epigloea TaxID=1892477 RepID=A0ABP0D2Z3_9PEZI